MSVLFRAALIITAIGFFIWVMMQIRKARMRIEDSIFWAFFSLTLIILGIFPGILITVADFFSIYSSVNFLFLVIIFILIAKLFRMTIRVSQLEGKLQDLAQVYAINKKDNDEK